MDRERKTERKQREKVLVLEMQKRGVGESRGDRPEMQNGNAHNRHSKADSLGGFNNQDKREIQRKAR